VSRAAPGTVVWITGLPASGKSTLAGGLRARLGGPSLLLDSDELRPILGAAGYDEAARDDFYHRLARLAALLAGQGATVIVAATAGRARYRERARALAPRFLEVWVKTPLEEAERRDPKGIYARARRGEAPSVPGLGAPYEPPPAPDVVAAGGLDEQALAELANRLEPATPPS
jgi:adenylylsulfate kinase